MNDEDFEDKLRALTGMLVRPDPTAAWKADILARAHRTRDKDVSRTPRAWLALLGTVWLLIAILRVTTPSDESTLPAERGAATLAMQDETTLRMLIAFRSNPESLDFP